MACVFAVVGLLFLSLTRSHLEPVHSRGVPDRGLAPLYGRSAPTLGGRDIGIEYNGPAMSAFCYLVSSSKNLIRCFRVAYDDCC
jgi:hypothetical protein